MAGRPAGRARCCCTNRPGGDPHRVSTAPCARTYHDGPTPDRAVVETDHKDKGQAVALEVRLTNKAGSGTAHVDPAVVEAEYTDIMKGAAHECASPTAFAPWPQPRARGRGRTPRPPGSRRLRLLASTTTFSCSTGSYVGPPSADKPALIPKSVLARVVERLEEEFWTRYKQKHANKAIAFPVHLRHMLLLTQQPQEAVIAFLERASIVQRQVQARRPPDTPPLPEWFLSASSSTAYNRPSWKRSRILPRTPAASPGRAPTTTTRCASS